MHSDLLLKALVWVGLRWGTNLIRRKKQVRTIATTLDMKAVSNKWDGAFVVSPVMPLHFLFLVSLLHITKHELPGFVCLQSNIRAFALDLCVRENGPECLWERNTPKKTDWHEQTHRLWTGTRASGSYACVRESWHRHGRGKKMWKSYIAGRECWTRVAYEPKPFPMLWPACI